MNTLGPVIVHGLGRTDRRTVQVRLVARVRVPGTREIIGHQVPEVEGRVHLSYMELAVVVLAAGGSDGEEEAVPGPPLGVGVEGCAELAEEVDVPGGLGVVLGVLVVDVEPVEAVVLEELEAAPDELGALGWVDDDGVHAGAVCPAADAEEEFEVPVLFLDEVQSFEVSVEAEKALVVGRKGRVKG